MLLEMLIAPMVVRTAIMKQALAPGFVQSLADHVLRLAGTEPATGAVRRSPRRSGRA